jgi:hypothetical protein
MPRRLTSLVSVSQGPFLPVGCVQWESFEAGEREVRDIHAFLSFLHYPSILQSRLYMWLCSFAAMFLANGPFYVTPDLIRLFSCSFISRVVTTSHCCFLGASPSHTSFLSCYVISPSYICFCMTMPSCMKVAHPAFYKCPFTEPFSGELFECCLLPAGCRL